MKQIWWCEEHNWNGWPDEDICLWVRVGRDQGAYNTPCRMVEMQLVPADARWYEEGSEALPPSKWIGQ